MKPTCIYNIDFKTSNNEVISISSDNFDHFYICNLDDDGNEIGYLNEDDTFVANFMMMKINNMDEEARDIINRIKKNNISIIELCFTNGYRQAFKIPKKRVVKNGKMHNECQELFDLDNSLGIIITDKKLKYKKELFA